MNRKARRAYSAQARKSYIHRLFSLYGNGNLEAGVHHLAVAHSDRCNHFKGGACSCEPTLTRRIEGSDTVELIERDGTIVKAH